MVMKYWLADVLIHNQLLLNRIVHKSQPRLHILHATVVLVTAAYHPSLYPSISSCSSSTELSDVCSSAFPVECPTSNVSGVNSATGTPAVDRNGATSVRVTPLHCIVFALLVIVNNL